MFEINPIVFELSNGIKVVYLQRDAFVAHMGVMIHAGSMFEMEHEEGLAHFLEHSIFKGTNKRRAIDIFNDLDSVGGELNAYTNKEEICIHASFRRNYFSIASELLGDITQNGSFPKKEIEKEKEVVLDEIISYLDTPSERIFDDFEARLFGGHAAGRNTLGTKESVMSFSPKTLSHFRDRLFTSENIVLSFVGDVSLEEVKNVFERDFGQIKANAEQRELDLVPEFKPFNIIENKANYQTHTVLGGRAPSYNDEERKAMALLINVLGGPALNSRLNLSVREEYGYAYTVEAGFSSYSKTGLWSVYMGTDLKYLNQAKDIVYKEIRSIRETPLTKDELRGAKEQIKGHMALSLDSNLDLMFSLAKSLLNFGKVDSMQKVYKSIDDLTVDQLAEVSGKWFSESNIGELIYTT